jgi:ATP-binding protein involved in chromosome partitioning
LRPSSDGESIVPVDFAHGIKVMSMGFLLPNRDDAIIWRGPMKMNVLKQLLTEIKWGELDYLIVDFPPGTGDEPLSVAQLIPECDGAIIVTTPQDLSLNDVRKCINFCRQVNVPVVGVLENMSGLVCPNCNTVIEIFKAGGGEKMAKEMEVPFLGRIPLDPQIVEASDSGKPFVYHHSKTEAAKVFIEAVQTIMNTAEKEKAVSDPVIFSKNAEGICKIAVPVVEGHLSAHFGHCDEFVFFDVDLARGEIVGEVKATPPPHEPGVLPAWLGEMGANLIIAGGMGTRAQDLFKQKGIEVLIGASSEEPLKIIDSFINGTFTGGQNICDH